MDPIDLVFLGWWSTGALSVCIALLLLSLGSSALRWWRKRKQQPAAQKRSGVVALDGHAFEAPEIMVLDLGGARYEISGRRERISIVVPWQVRCTIRTTCVDDYDRLGQLAGRGIHVSLAVDGALYNGEGVIGDDIHCGPLVGLRLVGVSEDAELERAA